jgi:hypothetical protein
VKLDVQIGVSSPLIELARQCGAARHPGILRHHGQLPLRPENDRGQPTRPSRRTARSCARPKWTPCSSQPHRHSASRPPD